MVMFFCLFYDLIFVCRNPQFLLLSFRLILYLPCVMIIVLLLLGLLVLLRLLCHLLHFFVTRVAKRGALAVVHVDYDLLIVGIGLRNTSVQEVRDPLRLQCWRLRRCLLLHHHLLFSHCIADLIDDGIKLLRLWLHFNIISGFIGRIANYVLRRGGTLVDNLQLLPPLQRRSLKLRGLIFSLLFFLDLALILLLIDLLNHCAHFLL